MTKALLCEQPKSITYNYLYVKPFRVYLPVCVAQSTAGDK